MFYSPTILAKKSPMGTIWMAAHLERKVKKAQIEKINITIYAEKLLFPEVPIALRMSAHLLLGLVRIFAWKVDYTFSDCNRLLTDIRTAIVNIKIDLPTDANQAPPQSVTLPSNFQLDGIDLDDLVDDAEGLDGHRKTFDQITTTDFTAGGGENYVCFLIDENDSSSLSNQSIQGAESMDDMLPPCSDHVQELITNEKNTEAASAPTNLDEGESQFHDTMDNQFECALNRNQDNPNENQSDEFHDILRGSQFDIPNENQCQDIPNENQSDASTNENQFHDNISKNLNRDSPIEQFRSLHPLPPLAGNGSIGATCQFSASPNINSNAARDSFTPVELQLDASPEEIILVNQNVPRLSPQRENDVPSPRSANMKQDAVELAIAPSPLPVRERRKRKKMQLYFDRHIVLSNKKMKEQLKDTAVNMLIRKRRKLPSSRLDAWRYQRASVKDQIFDQQLISWKFASLQEKRTYPPIINEESDMHPPVGPTQQSPNHGISMESFNTPVHTMPQSSHHDMGTVEEAPVKSPVGPLYHSPNHKIFIEEPSRDPPVGPPYGSPNYETYFDEPTINPPASPTQWSPIDVDAPPERLRCQHVNETIPVPSPPVDLGWKTPNSNNNLLNSPSNALPTFEPEILDNSSRSPPAKRTWPMSQSPWTPSNERENFRTPPLRWSSKDLNFLETPPSVKAKRARIEDGNLSPSVLLGDDSERRELNSWSARSMGMAKYLREHFPVVPNKESQDGNISLNHILEEKARKHCARMFFETLVLTTCEYIHVKQEEAYGDVLITPRPRLTATKY